MVRPLGFHPNNRSSILRDATMPFPIWAAADLVINCGIISRGRVQVTQRAHIPSHAGSNPVPATILRFKRDEFDSYFCNDKVMVII